MFCSRKSQSKWKVLNTSLNIILKYYLVLLKFVKQWLHDGKKTLVHFKAKRLQKCVSREVLCKLSKLSWAQICSSMKWTNLFNGREQDFSLSQFSTSSHTAAAAQPHNFSENKCIGTLKTCQTTCSISPFQAIGIALQSRVWWVPLFVWGLFVPFVRDIAWYTHGTQSQAG